MSKTARNYFDFPGWEAGCYMYKLDVAVQPNAPHTLATTPLTLVWLPYVFLEQTSHRIFYVVSEKRINIIYLVWHILLWTKCDP